jgi:hypothetical protein
VTRTRRLKEPPGHQAGQAPHTGPDRRTQPRDQSPDPTTTSTAVAVAVRSHRDPHRDCHCYWQRDWQGVPLAHSLAVTARGGPLLHWQLHAPGLPWHGTGSHRGWLAVIDLVTD